ncbi:zinc ABC transporter substrate-binding protein ZnuA [Xenorhabdus nematophila]|uniref:High-affinity zinc uptake system protein ZnuA n=1 Tax=Xenorhabdus nematophila (strain ATCC 19061 / DSM 3370 / CCUG 14189 / LMG 1036 / NCIMB 9965 / AN6) TaxID=406817 RepID=D3VEW2_XENNA|nr:zinc ABC transporter substrate-binding protein ZnuA [Xenorhabdus nematophila]CEE94637.1 high-affinity Zn transport protein (ABC superfamily, peri_bind) [Xenorhabdus nematophila str. Anatoliense]CBJ90224.1 high-affinity Zn transport protein (ABC superfamily, peri_bind) [Xenorhabdus nematophila ATCC 19061]CCW32195.1 High-affinity zinc uptake system protein znuA [Xenorhabdus nematophila F1]CEE96029.1 high-affinity Zn transport protein (ABC superfamily, peri_bind) [Xenorhabdus nematophila str. A
MLHKPQKSAHKFFSTIALVTALMAGVNSSVQADVVTSIRPLGFIAAAIADGVTGTQVLLSDGASPHDYALRPLDVRKINQADLMVWIGSDMEIFLAKPIAKIEKNKQLALAELSTIKPLLLKNSEEDDDSDESYQHKHETDHEHHHHGEYNMHIWLSPEIAEKVAQAIYDRLIEQYPKQKQQLEVNLRKFNGQLTQTDKNIANILKPVQKQKYFVFHDAYGYFEKHYQLAPLGVFTVNPEIQPGAQKLHYIRTQLVEQKVKCIFAEPQFRPAVIHAVAKGTDVHIGVLDPLGSGIVLSKDSYMKFITQLSEQYVSCLN